MPAGQFVWDGMFSEVIPNQESSVDPPGTEKLKKPPVSSPSSTIVKISGSSVSARSEVVCERISGFCVVECVDWVLEAEVD